MLQKSVKKTIRKLSRRKCILYWFVSQKSSINGGVFSFQHPHGLNWYSIAAYRPVVASFKPWCLAMHPSQSEKSGCVWKPIMMPLAMIRIATCKNTGTTSVTHFCSYFYLCTCAKETHFISYPHCLQNPGPPPKKKTPTKHWCSREIWWSKSINPILNNHTLTLVGCVGCTRWNFMELDKCKPSW